MQHILERYSLLRNKKLVQLSLISNMVDAMNSESVTSLPPLKRAKTKEEREARRIQRVLRNRRAARISSEKKSRNIQMLKSYVQILEENYRVLQGNLERLVELTDSVSLQRAALTQYEKLENLKLQREGNSLLDNNSPRSRSNTPGLAITPDLAPSNIEKNESEGLQEYYGKTMDSDLITSALDQNLTSEAYQPPVPCNIQGIPNDDYLFLSTDNIAYYEYLSLMWSRSLSGTINVQRENLDQSVMPSQYEAPNNT